MNTKVSDKIKSLKDLKQRADTFQKHQNDHIVISLCSGTACKASADTDLYAEFEKEIPALFTLKMLPVLEHLKRQACKEEQKC